MIGSLPKPKRNRNAGRQPRAIWYRRWARMLKRKRVAVIRLQVCYLATWLQKTINRMVQVASDKNVPMDPVAPVPIIPTLPGQEWIDLKQDMGKLKPPIKPARPETQTQAMA